MKILSCSSLDAAVRNFSSRRLRFLSSDPFAAISLVVDGPIACGHKVGIFIDYKAIQAPAAHRAARRQPADAAPMTGNRLHVSTICSSAPARVSLQE
jgi:hypothetical protein